MFWKFNLLTSHIDTLLDKEDVTLTELMDEDDVLQECKAMNRKLIDFLVKPEIMEQMVNMVTQEPSEDCDEKVRYKYPNTACELLTSDITQINDMLAIEDTLLGKVYSFLEQEGPLNPLLASFFSKVMGLLITRKSEAMLDFLKKREDFVGHLLNHLGTSAIMDLLLRLITCIDSPECKVATINWLNEQSLVHKLVSMIDPVHSEEKHCNASQSLCDIIRLSREQMSQMQDKADHDPLLETIEAQETVTELLNHMFNGEKSESVLVSGLSVIQTLLEFKKIGPEGGAEQMTSLDAERFAQGVSKCLMAMTPRLKDLHNLLVDPPKQHYSAMPTTIGTLDPPLGNTRLQIARLVNSLIQTNTHAINTELANLGTLNVLLELYFKYVWNNFLHTQLEQCIGTILSNTPTEYENKQEHPLLDQLFSSTNLIQKILDGWEDNEQSISRPGGRRKGYMGHLTKISNHLVQSLEKSCNAARMTEHIKELPEKYREKWEAFSASTLTEANKKNTVELVGGHPLLSSSEDDDADFRDIPFPQDTAMQQAFSDYQLQQMTSNFIDQFGFNEEEFAEQEEPADNPFNEKVNSIDFAINTTETNPNTAMFEQACNERIQQFDDHDSDEDIWKEVTFTQNASNQGVSSGTAPVASPEVDEIASNSSDSDSEEDLESPAVIRQAPSSSTTEKMDVDNSDITMDSGPVAMDTANSPWENQPTSTSTPDTSSSGSSENWASFGETKNLTGEASQKEDEEWADFASFSPAPSDLASTDPGPRSSSPIAMDTVESTTENQTDRPNAYLVSSAPADLGSSVDQAKPDSTVTSGTVAHIDTTQSVAQESKDDVVSSTTGLPPPTSPKVASSSTPTETPSQGSPSTPSSSQTNPNTPTSSQPGQPPSDQPQPSSNVTPSNSASPGATSQSTEAETKPAVPSTEPTPLDNNHPQEDDDLQDNFNFLASAGLMRFDEPKATGNGPTSSEDSETATVEAARAKALEALQQFTSASSTPPAQNGPV